MKLSSRRISFLLLAPLTAISLYFLLCHFSVPSHLLEQRRINQLEAQNHKLHENIKALLENANLRYLSGIVGGGGEGDSIKHDEMNPEGKSQHSPAENSVGEEQCQIIHIAMVTAGSPTIRRAMIVIKSILFHRRNPLHFHFLADYKDREILSTIFETWQLPEVNISTYSLTDAIKMVEWIPNTHYSGVYGLTKLTLTYLLPVSLEAVIVLDTDLMLADDIGNLWKYIKFLKAGGKQVGLVENQSDWYLGTIWNGHKAWPAVGRGYNTGVVLLNLELMRMENWNKTWNSVARESLVTHGKTSLADQDIINAVIKKDRDLLFTLPCVWNVQLSENTLSDYCFRSNHFKIIHWNSAAKMDVRNIHAPHFKNLFTMFEDYNSNLFRTHLSDCPSILKAVLPESMKKDDDPCEDIRKVGNAVYRLHPFYLGHSYEPEGDDDVTLVTQMSMDRLHMLEPLCKHWDGPISLAFYATDIDLRKLIDHVKSSLVLRDLNRLAIHAVTMDSSYYPVNFLRNVALGRVQTPYVYLSDIDFLPMFSLYHYLRTAIRVIGADKRALVVPAFESLLYKIDFPRNKSQVVSMLNAGDLFTFRYHVWKKGHSPTNFDYWRKAERPYKVKWISDFEPYVVVKSDVVKYDTRFVGFGWNKVSQMMELDSQGYEFVVLPEAFMVHMPHAPSADIVHYRQTRHYRDCMQVLKREFQRELTLKYERRES